MLTEIKGFFHDYRFLSNFWFCSVLYEGLTYPSVEHAYQAAKTLDPAERLLFLEGSPAAVKTRGRHISLRQDWEQVKDDVMFQLLTLKFHKPTYRAKLLATGDAYLEETNTWGDQYWGVCRGKGKNMLGILLMRVREMLRTEDQNEATIGHTPAVLNMRDFRSVPLPPTAVLVDRTTKWGNPFKVGRDAKTNEEAVKMFEAYLDKHPELKEAAKRELKGKDPVCWCVPKACHGNVWLKVANED